MHVLVVPLIVVWQSLTGTKSLLSLAAKLSSSGSDSEREEDQSSQYQQYESMEMDTSGEVQSQNEGGASFTYEDENAQDYNYNNQSASQEADEGDNFDPTAFFNSSILQGNPGNQQGITADIGNDLQVSESESEEDFVAVEEEGGDKSNQAASNPYDFM